MNWKYVKTLKDNGLVKEFEEKNDFNFPNEFVDLVNNFNGGRPEKSAFVTQSGKERAIKGLLSFNKDDIETIWKISDWNKSELDNKYIAFAIDNFGNLICFDKSSKNIVFIEMETLKSDLVSSSISEFISTLY